jgi:hypothetical protein
MDCVARAYREFTAARTICGSPPRLHRARDARDAKSSKKTARATRHAFACANGTRLA